MILLVTAWHSFRLRTPSRPLAILLLSWLVFPVRAGFGAESSPPSFLMDAAIEPFLQQHCRDCHTGPDPSGGLDLARLPTDLSDPAALARWIRLYDRIAAGEMPPSEAPQPTAGDRAHLLGSLKVTLERAHAAGKQTVLRRLNRREYQNTLNDLFGTDLDLIDLLPADGRSHEFDNVGESLGISMVQLQRYLEIAELVLDASIVKTLEPPERKLIRASYADTRGVENFLGKQWLKLPDGAMVFYKQFGYPTGMLREANVQRDGWYHVKVTGYAHQSDRPITFSIGATTFQRGVKQPTFGYFSLPPGRPSSVEVLAYIPARYMIDVTPWGITDPDNEIRANGIEAYRGPGLAIQSVEVDGPIVDEFPGRGHRLLFDGLAREEIPPRNPADRQRSWYQPRFEIHSSDPSGDVTPVLERVATAAFRRPLNAGALAPYLTLFQSELAGGAPFETALRTAVSAILCSPEFLFLQEPQGRLDDYALAARLSYFLHRSSPDQELLEQAAAGRLTGDPQVLRQQTQRLLEDPRSRRFVEDFTDSWLNLREIEFTNPDQQLFPEFDAYLQWSMVEETRAFWRELIDRNLPVANIVRSDFAMLNERLAEHYAIPGVEGPEIRAVTLPPDSPRGGFLAQGSVLKVSANGNNTSPVVRGVWVLERILGETTPPPPPGIPGVEPDIRGATTLRELLDRHRSVESCNGCHRRIDPPGFALESFDPIGGYREHFRSLGEGERVNRVVRGFKVRYKLGSPVDASGAFPDGSPFDGFVEFRDQLATRSPVLAKTLLTKLLTFACGREMGFSDRDEIDRLVRQAEADGYGTRDLIHLVIASEAFRHK